jgi:hypothetical protein
MVREFSDVFFKVLSGIPPKRQAKVPIDILLGTTYIAQSPYRMALMD